TARNIARQEMVEKILGALYLQEYDRDHVLFRITVEDFADLLADHLVRARLAPEALKPDELADLLNQASEYLNNEGMPWVEIINLALVDAWPDRIPLPDHER
ncbi:MAG: hypothetical protein RBS68_16495, partial [Anaerolineales bacterium]|nr:hypothetical protein [Anaerolineales bacterium]